MQIFAPGEHDCGSLLQFLTQSIADSPTDIERDTSQRPPRLCWFNDSDIEWILIKIILMMSISTFRSYVDTDGDDQPNDQDGRQPYKAQPILDSFQPRALEPCRP